MEVQVLEKKFYNLSWVEAVKSSSNINHLFLHNPNWADNIFIKISKNEVYQISTYMYVDHNMILIPPVKNPNVDIGWTLETNWELYSLNINNFA